MKKLVLIGLVAALSCANVLAVSQDTSRQTRSPAQTTEVALAEAPAKVPAAVKPQTVALKDLINCGFICDSFGRCRRVCW